MINPLGGLGQELRNSLVLAVIPASGSLRDWSQTGAAVTIGSTPHWERRDGRLVYMPDLANTSDLTYAHNAKQDLTGDWTWFVSGIQEQIGLAGITNTSLWRKLGAGTRQMFWIHGGAIKVYNGTVTSQYVTSLVGVKSIAIHNSAAGTPAMFTNGVLLGNGSSAITFASCTGDVETDFTNAVGTPALGHATLLGFDAKLTGQEIATLHDWSTSLRTPNKVWPGHGAGYIARPSMVVPNEPACVGAWDLSLISNGTVPDLSGKGNTGTVSGNVQVVQTPTGKAARYGAGASVGCGTAAELGVGDFTMLTTVRLAATPTSNQSIAAKYLNSNNRWQWYLTSTAIAFYAKTASTQNISSASSFVALPNVPYRLGIVGRRAGNLSYFVNGVKIEDTDAFENQNTLTNAGPLTLGADPTIGSLGGVQQDVKILGRALADEEVAADYNRFARLCTFDSFSSDWRVSLANEGGAVGQRISNTCFKTGDTVGQWRVVDDPTVEGGRALECITAGALYVPSEQAFGTWEFDLFQNGPSTVVGLWLVCSTNDLSTLSGYSLFSNTGEQVVFREYVGGATVTTHFLSPLNYLVNDTWYRFKMARRSTDGRFSAYIRGGAYTTWTLIATSTGSNPVADMTQTTSKYMVIDADAGDRIANIRRMNGEVLP